MVKKLYKWKQKKGRRDIYKEKIYMETMIYVQKR